MILVEQLGTFTSGQLEVIGRLQMMIDKRLHSHPEKVEHRINLNRLLGILPEMVVAAALNEIYKTHYTVILSYTPGRSAVLTLQAKQVDECMTAATAVAYGDGDHPTVAKWQAHIAQCSDCREAVELILFARKMENPIVG